MKLELNESERRVLVHALTGSSGKSVYRNWYAASDEHHAASEIKSLVNKGFMRAGRKFANSGQYYHVTAKGMEVVGLAGK